jgi:hypothetical protein
VDQSTSGSTSVQTSTEVSANVSLAPVAESSVDDSGVSSAISEPCETDILAETRKSMDKSEVDACSGGGETSDASDKQSELL